jgi:hypothetical protein
MQRRNCNLDLSPGRQNESRSTTTPTPQDGGAYQGDSPPREDVFFLRGSSTEHLIGHARCRAGAQDGSAYQGDSPSREDMSSSFVEAQHNTSSVTLGAAPEHQDRSMSPTTSRSAPLAAPHLLPLASMVCQKKGRSTTGAPMWKSQRTMILVVDPFTILSDH